MAANVGESTSGSGSGGDAGGSFDCNICFELPQEPIVTLCGHLFCWPCIYKWLHIHSHSPECPVCKAVVEEDKLVPLYGRGKDRVDPSSSRFQQGPNMAANVGESTSGSGSGGDAGGSFECNICFELPQEPIVTLCGHLFCWPCLYEWLHIHSHSPECPVCKAVVEEEKLVPLYGRSKDGVDPRSKNVPGAINMPTSITMYKPFLVLAYLLCAADEIFPMHGFLWCSILDCFI